MAVRENIALLNRWGDLLSSPDLSSMVDVLDDYLTPNYTYHRPGSPDIHRGTESGDKHLIENTKQMSGFHITVLDMFGEDDKVAGRLEYSFMQKSTGKRFKFTAISIVRFEDGKMAEEWEYAFPMSESD